MLDRVFIISQFNALCSFSAVTMEMKQVSKLSDLS